MVFRTKKATASHAVVAEEVGQRRPASMASMLASRCRPLDVPRSHPSLLINEELARAIRHESAAAISFWWGVSESVIWRWRKALGVSRTNNEGSQRLIRAASERGAKRTRGRPLTLEQVERRRCTAHELNLGRFLREAYHESQWTKAEERLLGKVPDAEVARRTGRTLDAVRQKRQARARDKRAATR